ncbi:MAG: tripartite tricarboxylate transporter substrate binding protein [Burkholderiaceae bacterium]
MKPASFRRIVGCLIACAGAAASLLPPAAYAQDYPAKPIRMIVPFSVGGPTDGMARDLAKRMADELGQPVIVDNRPGSGGNIGADMVARAAPDGYTLLFASNGPLAGNPSLYRSISYDPIKSFAPITAYAAIGNILAVHPSMPVQTLQELLQLVKSSPGKYSYASGGSGTTQHFSGELLKAMLGLDLAHVPYKGEAPAMTDALGGQVPIVFCSFSSCLAHVRSGKLRALAVTTARRNTALPTVPSLSEALPGYEMSAWYGLVAPSGTPAAVIRKLNAVAVRLIRSEAVASRIASYGGESMAGTPEEFGQFIQTEAVHWAQVVKTTHATVD